MRSVFFLLALFLLSSNAGAECGISNPSISDCIADGVSAGVDKSLEKSADGLINTASNTTNTNVSKTDPIQSFVLNMLDPSFDPANIPWVIQTRDFTALIYVILAVMYFTWGAAFHMLRNAIPGIGTEIDWVLHTHYKDFYFSQYAANGLKALVFPALGYFLLTYLLMISGAFTRLAISDTMANMIPGSMDPIVYFIMAAIVLLLAIFIAMRYIIITIFSAFLLVVLAAYLFDEIRPIASMLLKYLVILIFMPFILSMIASAGIAFIEGTPWLMVSRPVEYIALGLVMLIAAIVMIFGWSLVLKTAKTGAFVAAAAV